MADASLLRCLAFFLPQFHPIPENDHWWGPGFTEWTNVVKGRPLFRGHQQPHLPRDLGFYDLRLPETRFAQVELAQEHGVDGFCYYHYWFEGRRLLERPVDDTLRSGEPDFPFLLCWANENWTRVWNGGAKDVLLAEAYSAEDDLRHIRWLASAFSDPRYVRVDGRPVFLVYRPGRLPHAKRTAEVWRTEALRLGVGDPYLCAVEAHEFECRRPEELGFDAAVQFAPDFADGWPRLPQTLPVQAFRKYLHPKSPYRMNRVYDYATAVRNRMEAPSPPYKRFPCVTPGFDNTARRPNGGARVVINSTPELYGNWLRTVVDRFQPYSADENLLFVNAWNEWAEGNHLEPCQRWGRGYLEAHRRAVGPAGPSSNGGPLGRDRVVQPLDVAHQSSGTEQVGGAGGGGGSHSQP